jgi:hypothetical protein
MFWDEDRHGAIESLRSRRGKRWGEEGVAHAEDGLGVQNMAWWETKDLGGYNSGRHV